MYYMETIITVYASGSVRLYIFINEKCLLLYRAINSGGSKKKALYKSLLVHIKSQISGLVVRKEWILLMKDRMVPSCFFKVCARLCVHNQFLFIFPSACYCKMHAQQTIKRLFMHSMSTSKRLLALTVCTHEEPTGTYKLVHINHSVTQFLVLSLFISILRFVRYNCSEIRAVLICTIADPLHQFIIHS